MKGLIMFLDRCFEFGLKRITALNEIEVKDLTKISFLCHLYVMKIGLFHNLRELD